MPWPKASDRIAMSQPLEGEPAAGSEPLAAAAAGEAEPAPKSVFELVDEALAAAAEEPA